jgi:hypothetical protein
MQQRTHRRITQAPTGYRAGCAVKVQQFFYSLLAAGKLQEVLELWDSHSALFKMAEI